jgi:hypothetical protein
VDSPDLVRALAIAIRPCLAELVGPGWETVDRELADMLALDGSSRFRDRAIVDTLDRNERTRGWAARFMTGDASVDDGAREPSREITRGGYSALAGVNAVGAPVFVCRKDGYRWSRHDDDDPVPPCPIDRRHPPLVPVAL